jgi:hypothetical protein
MSNILAIPERIGRTGKSPGSRASNLIHYHIGLWAMKQIICRWFKLKIPLLLVPGILLFSVGPLAADDKGRVYQIIGPVITAEPSSPSKWTLEKLEAKVGTKEISSLYFDKALDYKGSKFRVISLAGLVRLFDPKGQSNAVLLECFDDYQGILSIADIERYDIQLATRINIRPEFNKPDWLNPLLVIVPDNKKAPFQERYLTANIRELRFTRLDEYYAPLRKAGGDSAGYSAFKDNCLFCHSLMGVGGNKGVRLLESYDFSRMDGKNRFRKDFAAFHHKANKDKQNVEQFVSESQLEDLMDFLRRVQKAK